MRVEGWELRVEGHGSSVLVPCVQRSKQAGRVAVCHASWRLTSIVRRLPGASHETREAHLSMYACGKREA
jgi:hypothetical protein